MTFVIITQERAEQVELVREAQVAMVQREQVVWQRRQLHSNAGTVKPGETAEIVEMNEIGENGEMTVVFSQQDRADAKQWAPLRKEVNLHTLSNELADDIFAIANDGQGDVPISLDDAFVNSADRIVATLNVVGIHKETDEFLSLVNRADLDNSKTVTLEELNYALWSWNWRN